MAYWESNGQVIDDLFLLILTLSLTLKVQTRDSTMLRAQYLESSWRCLATVAN